MKNKKNQEFSDLIKSYESAFWRVVITYEANKAEQEELFQEILFEVWKSLQNFQNRSHLKTYVFRVAHNVAFKHVTKQIRLNKNTISVEAEKSVGNLEIDMQQTQRISSLNQAIRKLPIQQREIVCLALEGLTYPEISEIAGISESNVGVILNRSKKKLKELMETHS